MSIKVYAVIFGILFLAVGILGFVPTLTPNGYLLGIFQVDKVHSVFHILTGIIALIVTVSSYGSRMFFKIFGCVYLFIAALGILLHGDFVFAHVNPEESLFNIVLAAIAIYLGFGKVKKPVDKAV